MIKIPQWLRVILLFALFNNPLPAKETIELAICAIFQDDAKYIPEWIDFHCKQGVQHFYLYDNLSTDSCKTILQPYIDRNIVTLIEWPYKQQNVGEWNQIQCGAYMDCVEKIRGKVKWCAFFDTDEFCFCTDGTNLRTYLKKFRKFAALSVNWVMYGTSGIYDIPTNKSMLETLVYRAENNFGPHIHVKTIAQPKYIVSNENPHYFLYQEGKFAVTENKEPFSGPFSPSISFNQIRINHYWSRDGHFFETVKCPRQRKWSGGTENAINGEKKMNAIYDPISNYVKIGSTLKRQKKQTIAR
jgi:hypothetical protein